MAYVQHQRKEYVATAALQFTTNPLPSQVAGVPANQSVDPEGEKSTDLQSVTTTAVAAQVVSVLQLRTTPSDLLGQVSATNPKDDYIVDVSVTDPSPLQAARIANAFVQEYVAYSQFRNQNVLTAGEALINRRLAQLSPTDSVQRRNLQALSQKLLLLQAVQAPNAQVLDKALPPSSPSSPKKKTTVAVALLFGALLGIGLSFLLNLLDRRVSSIEEFEELFGVPALAGIPKLPRRASRPSRAKTVWQRSVITTEPFRILLNGLSLLSTLEVKTVLVTSAAPGDGKTTVALELARAAAQSGQTVILVEGDVRRPVLKRWLGLGADSRGLTSVMESGEDPVELLQPMPGLSRLRVLVCGPGPRDATNALQPDKLFPAFQALAAHADLVVVDSAPLLAVVDTRVLLDEVGFDACLIVARAGTTTRDEARQVRSVLERRHQAGVGLVVNAIVDVSNQYYYYGDHGESRTGRTRGEFAGSTRSPTSMRATLRMRRGRDGGKKRAEVEIEPPSS